MNNHYFTIKRNKDMDDITTIENRIKDSIQIKQKLLADKALISTIEYVVTECIQCFKSDGKLLFCGNGGSAADAQHLAAEFSGKFYIDREPLFAEALHVNTSYLTAVANDYSYLQIYSRMIRAKGRKGDILFGISTSGNSENIVEAFKISKEIGIKTVGMTGDSGGKLKSLSDFLINIPSSDTPRIQECHILTGHIICELVEEKLFGVGG